jgi:hypothetical protein
MRLRRLGRILIGPSKSFRPNDLRVLVIWQRDSERNTDWQSDTDTNDERLQCMRAMWNAKMGMPNKVDSPVELGRTFHAFTTPWSDPDSHREDGNGPGGSPEPNDLRVLVIWQRDSERNTDWPHLPCVYDALVGS